MRARPSAAYLLPYHAVRLRLQLAKVYLALAEQATVRQLPREIDDIVSRRPSAPPSGQGAGRQADHQYPFQGDAEAPSRTHD